MMALRSCPTCGRHVHDELVCPFCEADLSVVGPAIRDDLAPRPAPKYGMPPSPATYGVMALVIVGAVAVAYVYLTR